MMHKRVKFVIQLDGAVLEELRETARELNQNTSELAQDALVEHLKRVRIGPAFRSAMDEVLDEHEDLLERLVE